MQDNSDVRRFGEAFLDYLIAAEIVSRGTGPAKFLPADTYQNTIIFDTATLTEDQLPSIWRESEIVAARKIGMTHPDKRKNDFEGEYGAARRDAWWKFRNLYTTAYDAAMGIDNPHTRSTRLSELEALKANYDLAGFHLGMSGNKPSFMNAQLVITGNCSTKSDLDLEVESDFLTHELLDLGIKGNDLGELMSVFERTIRYMPEDSVLDSYRRLIEMFSLESSKMLELDPGYLHIEVKALPKTEYKTGSFEYEGDGKAVTSIRVSDTIVQPRLVLTTSHEMTHLLQAVLSEIYFHKTGDLFGAVGTMCTSSAALNEGIAEMGTEIYRNTVLEALKDKNGTAGIIRRHNKLRRDLFDYTSRLAYERTYMQGQDPAEVAKELEAIHLRYGIDEKSARVIAEGMVDINRQHKNMFYTPFYGISRIIVERAVADSLHFPSVPHAIKDYMKRCAVEGPMTLAAFRL